MKYLYIKNKKIINRVYKDELKRSVYKSLFYNTSINKDIRKKSFFLLMKMGKQSSISYLKPRCLWTNNSRAVLTFCKLSRFKFRMLSVYGYIPGIRKASW